jgi:Ca-activated chloride channel family protein
MQIFKSPTPLLALALSLLVGAPAQATGWVMIDPALVRTPPVARTVQPPNIHWPFNPRPPVTPVRPPLLKGSVSFGLHLQSQDVQVTVADQVAKTYIKQVFANDTDQNLAGTYMFPLPQDTTFSSFSLHIDGKPVEGKILEAEAARQQYEEIVRRMVDPGLLEYADYKTVRARIFPIPPHGTKTVELEYTQLLKAENGMLKYSFPLKSEGQSDPSDEIKVKVDLSSKQGLRAIWSPSHQVTLQRDGDHKAKISLLEKNSLPDKDFLLCYSVSDKELAANLLNHKNPGEDGYFLLTIAPPLNVNKAISKDVVFVVDTSGSMQGQKLEETKRAIKFVLNAMNPDDRFGIIQFNTDVDYFKSRLMPVTGENKKAALNYVEELEARGGTNINDALQSGCQLLNEVTDRPAYLILMTDGEPTVGEISEAKIIKNVAPKREVRLFDFGVGYDVNTRLLNKLAESHHGTSQYVEPNENLEIAVGNFYQKIKSPLLSDVKIDYEGVETKDVYPREVKDIFAGTQVMLLGKYKQPGKCTVKLTGKVNGVAKAYSFPLTFQGEETANTYLPRLWAMRRIGHLTDVAHDNGNSREVIDEIVALSKKYGIITEFTSFLVTDPSENNLRLGHGVAMTPPPPPGVGGGFMSAFSATDAGALRAARPVSASRSDVARKIAHREASAQRFGQSNEVGMDAASMKGAPMMQQVAQAQFAAPGDAFGGGARDFEIGGGSVSGSLAVKKAKTVNQLKDMNYVAENKQIAGAVKSVADKTFYLRGDVWVESAIDAAKEAHAKVITFASKEYFDLIRTSPAIAKYLAVGQQVMLEFNGQVYKIVPAAKAIG